MSEMRRSISKALVIWFCLPSVVLNIRETVREISFVSDDLFNLMNTYQAV